MESQEYKRKSYLERQKHINDERLRRQLDEVDHNTKQDDFEIEQRVNELLQQNSSDNYMHPTLKSSPHFNAESKCKDKHIYPGTYGSVDDLDYNSLKNFARRDCTGINAQNSFHGKYHSHLIKNHFAVAGSQLKIEREQENIEYAKRKILMDPSVVKESVRPIIKIPVARDLDNFSVYINKMSAILKNHEDGQQGDYNYRLLRLDGMKYPAMTEEYWTLFYNNVHDVVAWVNEHKFADINIPVQVITHSMVDKVFGLTPLMAACRSLSPKLVQALINQGADTRLTNANGDTAGHQIFRGWNTNETITNIQVVTDILTRATNSLSILQILISKDADLSAPNIFGETILQSCARLGLVDCVDLLLSYEVDTDICDRHGKSAAAYAKENNHDSLHKTILNHGVVTKFKRAEEERVKSMKLLKKRGTLTAIWGGTAVDKFLSDLTIQELHTSHLQKQYVDKNGKLIMDNTEEGTYEDIRL